MEVLVIGATGAVGLPLVSQLVERGHAVVGTSRTQRRCADWAPSRPSSTCSTERPRAGWRSRPGRTRSSTRRLRRRTASTSGASPTQIRGASNAKAKRELGWTLRYPSWRHEFPATYGVARAA
jgi:hypothetical protein